MLTARGPRNMNGKTHRETCSTSKHEPYIPTTISKWISDWSRNGTHRKSRARKTGELKSAAYLSQPCSWQGSLSGVPGTRPGKYIEKHATFQTVNHEDEESGVLDDLFSNVHGTSAVVCERKAGGQGAKPGQASWWPHQQSAEASTSGGKVLKNRSANPSKKQKIDLANA